MLGGLGWATIDRELVVWAVYGSPVGNVILKASFHFPVLDQILDEIWETGCFVVLGLS